MGRIGVPGQNVNPLAYTDVRLSTVPVVHAKRRPTTDDKYYPIFCEWRVDENPSTGVVGEFWKLVKFTSGNAIWVLIGDSEGSLTGLRDQANVVVDPDPGTGDIDIDGVIVANATNPLPLYTVADAGNYTLDIELQVSTTVASPPANTNDAGIASFYESQFSVDANGFVKTRGNTVNWTVISQATQPANLEVNTGYICEAGGTGNVSVALPTTSSLGDLIEIVLDGADSWTITQGAGQQIRASGSQTTLGAGGSIATTGTGDHIRLVCHTADTIWVSVGYMGNLTIT